MKADGSLTKREVKKAALMLNLATLYMMNGDATTEEQIDVAEEAKRQISEQWDKYFPDLEKPTSFQGCIDAVKEMRKNNGGVL